MHFGVLKVASSKKKEKENKFFHLLWSLIVIQNCGKESNEQKQTNEWGWPSFFHKRVAMHLQINK
jgi:hypothetical protein